MNATANTHSALQSTNKLPNQPNNRLPNHTTNQATRLGFNQPTAIVRLAQVFLARSQLGSLASGKTKHCVPCAVNTQSILSQPCSRHYSQHSPKPWQGQQIHKPGIFTASVMFWIVSLLSRFIGRILGGLTVVLTVVLTEC